MDRILKFIWRKFSNLTEVSPVFRYFYFGFLHFFDSTVNYIYAKKSFKATVHINCDASILANRDVLDIVTVSFNTPEVIKWQINFLKKNLQDKFIYTVADNSSDPEAAKNIESVCEQNGVGYIRLPKNPYNGRLANWSHGLALNWTYKNFIKPRGARFFAFIDHDILPTQPVAIIPVLRNYLIYGAVHTRGNFWYLWPGFSFFRSDIFNGRRVNFTAVGITTLHSHASFDTGGGNWQDVYSRTDRKMVKEASYRFALLNQSTSDRPFDWLEGQETVHKNYDNGNLGASDELIEFIDTWLHLRRISYGDKTAAAQKLNRLLSYFNS